MSKSFMIKLGFLWIIFCTWPILLLYRIKKEPLALFLVDIKYHFNSNPGGFWYILLIWLLVTTVCIAAFLNEKILFYWKVRIGKLKFTIGFPAGFQKNMNRAIFLGSGAIVILLVSFGTMNDNTGKRDDTVWNQYPVAHALGSVDGIAYTNSLEAFDTNYKLGQRVFEADFCVTSDHKMVLRHEWDSDYQKGIDANNIPTEEEFTAVPILGSYTPLTLKDLLLLMQKYTDIYLITDTKDSEKALVQEEFEILLNTAKETGTEDVLNRIIVQIYDNEMLDTINEIYEFPIYIYTMYQIWGGDIPEFVEFCKFCRANDISYITMFHFLVNPEVLEIAKAFDIDIYVHTVNDLEQAKNLLNSGVHGIYTDDITLDMLKED